MVDRQTSGDQAEVRVRSHWRPRTFAGVTATLLFIVLMLLAEPPAVFVIADRVEPVILGMPFLYVYLATLYVGMIAVLIWAMLKGL
jgi:hypothetical protein